jgi:hypothetical protein
MPGGDTKIIRVSMENRNIPKEYTEKLNNAYFRVTFMTDANVVFHFIKYKIRANWEFYQDYPISFSEIHGFISPDE